ncbi:MAG TPA: phosphoribosylanthranilate isomerase [Thermoleophilaceae bacterium]|nr:phosphoribosylanthranilate isomerase [Thermoleophilaceae bacterium]
MTRIKSCGITNLDDAELAVELGAWAVGLILWPGSRRACAPAAAEQIGAALHRRCEIAGVFVNATLDEVALAADRYGLTLLQLHGDEGPAYCREAARRTGCKVMKAVRVKDAAVVRGVEAFRTDYHLLDAYVPGTRGGTGETFAWDLLRHHRGSVPVVLSGGLTADNVDAAIAAARPYAVDSASGTESAPGRKDPAKLQAFARAVEHADDREPAGA